MVSRRLTVTATVLRQAGIIVIAMQFRTIRPEQRRRNAASRSDWSWPVGPDWAKFGGLTGAFAAFLTNRFLVVRQFNHGGGQVHVFGR